MLKYFEKCMLLISSQPNKQPTGVLSPAVRVSCDPLVWTAPGLRHRYSSSSRTGPTLAHGQAMPLSLPVCLLPSLGPIKFFLRSVTHTDSFRESACYSPHLLGGPRLQQKSPVLEIPIKLSQASPLRSSTSSCPFTNSWALLTSGSLSPWVF